MPHLSSVSIKAREPADLSPETAALEAIYAFQLDGMDADGNGKIDRTELLMFIRDVADRETKAKYVKLSFIGLVVLLVIFALSTFGTAWAVMALSKKVDARGDGRPGYGVALVSSDNGETLCTASGMVMMTQGCRTTSLHYGHLRRGGCADKASIAADWRSKLSWGFGSQRCA